MWWKQIGSGAARGIPMISTRDEIQDKYIQLWYESINDKQASWTASRCRQVFELRNFRTTSK